MRSPPSIRGSSSPNSSSSRARSGEVPARSQRRSRSSSGSASTSHVQRQELVALEPRDRLQALDIVLAEQPVAALRPPRRQQPAVLEVADLRDRDVGELRLQPVADRADRQQLRGGGFGSAHLSRKVRRYLPIWSSSPSESSADSTRLR